MPTTNPVTAPTITPNSATQGATNSKGSLDKDGFLRLLVGQLRQQDPMNAQGTEQMMAQMTQLSMLEQVTNLTKANEKLSTNMNTSQALQLVGKNVSYAKADGSTATGAVEKVTLDTKGVATLTVGGQPGIALGDVREVT